MLRQELEPVTEGSTDPIIHQLLNGDPGVQGVPVSIFGLTVTLILEDRFGVAVDTSSSVAVLDDDSDENRGKVQFSPNDGDFVAASSPYTWKWKVVDGNNKSLFWPNGPSAILRVYSTGK